MKDELEKAIRLLAERITYDVTGDEALKLTQAALNLAHVAATFENMKR